MLEESNTLNAETPEPQPEEKGNKTFLIVGGIFAGLIFLTLVCAAVYFLLIRPRTQAAQTAQEATVEAQRQTQIFAITATADAAMAASALPSPMPTKTLTNTPKVEDTAVVVVATPLSSPESDPATLAALQTQLAGQTTQTAEAIAAVQPGGSGPLPATGFFDEVGLPLMITLTVALMAVILIARRMRRTTH
jgi:ABC-type antimicrobial peptide transport system permease subunit